MGFIQGSAALHGTPLYVESELFVIKCKKCNSSKITKSGKVGGKQRYYCKVCGCHFTEGDNRTNEQIAAKKAMCVVLYSLGKVPFRKLSRIFHISPSLIYRWVVEAGCKTPNLKSADTVKQMSLNKAWPFIKSKADLFESSKPVTVATGDIGLGYSAIVILQHSDKDV